MTYTQSFYDTIADGCGRSAGTVVPIVGDLLRPHGVYDVGCGQGWWGRAFADLWGCDVLGMDGPWVEQPLVPFLPLDLSSEELPDLPRKDLVVCLEVAEHLPAERSSGLVAGLVRLGKSVLFSAAIPGQSGAGHVNCQWPRYWADLFAGHGYGCDDGLRWKVWDDATVEPWYRQNLMLFSELLPRHDPVSVVHPDIWAWKL